MAIAIWWIRRDIRLFDNQALNAALDRADTIVPVFIIDPALWHNRYAGEKRKAYLIDSLRSLDQNLRQLGSRLILRHGKPLAALTQLLRETGASYIFVEADFSLTPENAMRLLSVPCPLRS